MFHCFIQQMRQVFKYQSQLKNKLLCLYIYFRLLTNSIQDSGLNAALNDVQEDEMDCGVTVGTSSAEGKFSKSTASNQIPASVSNTNAISIVRASGTGSGQQQQIKQLQHQSVNRFDYLADAKGKTPDLNTATLDWISQLSECVPLTPRCVWTYLCSSTTRDL